MKEVVLIGDSIRQGYEDIVRRKLGNAANVWAPDDNIRDSRNLLVHLAEWVLARAPDVVHLNCGLHDLRRDFATGTLQVPLPDFEANLRSLFTQITQLPDTTLIWATITPVNEVWHHQNKPFDRFTVDVAAYNAVGLQLATEFGLPVNDLNQLVTANGRDTLLLPDGVHYTHSGYDLLGQQVAEAVTTYL